MVISAKAGITQKEKFKDLANVYYIPVHLHPFYRKKFHTGTGLCAVAEAAYEQIISLPMFPGMADENVEQVINVVQRIILQNKDK